MITTADDLDDVTVTPARYDETVTIPTDSYLAARAALDAGDQAGYEDAIADVVFDTVEALDLSNPAALFTPLNTDAIRNLADETPEQLSRWLSAYARTVAAYGLDPVADLFARDDINAIGLDALADADTLDLPADIADGLLILLASAASTALANAGAEYTLERTFRAVVGAAAGEQFIFTVTRADGPTPGDLAVGFARGIAAWRDTDKTIAVDSSDEAHASHAAACDELAALADGPVAHLLAVSDDTATRDLPASPARVDLTGLADWFTLHPDLIGDGSLIDNATRLLHLAYGNGTLDGDNLPATLRDPDTLTHLAAGFTANANAALRAQINADIDSRRPAHNLFAAMCTRRRPGEPTAPEATCIICDQ